MNECIKLGVILERQSQINRATRTFMYLTAFCALTHKIAIDRLEKKVAKLEKEIDELKSAKGE